MIERILMDLIILFTDNRSKTVIIKTVIIMIEINKKNAQKLHTQIVDFD